MAKDPIQIMAETLTTVLEDMTFTFIDSPEEELQTDDTEFLHATITFDGPSSGELSIAAPRNLCAQLAAGILGLEADEHEVAENISDTLGELLNVTCGNFTTAMFGDETVINQSIPVVKKLDKTAWQALQVRPGAVKFIVDDVPLIAHVAVEESR